MFFCPDCNNNFFYCIDIRDEGAKVCSEQIKHFRRDYSYVFRIWCEVETLKQVQGDNSATVMLNMFQHLK